MAAVMFPISPRASYPLPLLGSVNMSMPLTWASQCHTETYHATPCGQTLNQKQSCHLSVPFQKEQCLCLSEELNRSDTATCECILLLVQEAACVEQCDMFQHGTAWASRAFNMPAIV